MTPTLDGMVPSPPDVAGVPSASGDSELAPEGHAGPWQPQTIRDVEWCLARFGDAETERAEIDAQAKAAIDAIEKRRDSIVAKIDRRAQWFESQLEEWAKSHRDEIVKGKRKSRELLGGSIGFRASAEKVVVTDEAAVIAWAQDKHMELLNLKPRIDKKALDQFVLSTGEIPAGVDVAPASETITIKPHPLPTMESHTERKLP